MGSRLGNALVEAGLVTRDAVERAEACRRDHGGRLGSALVALGLIDSQRLAEFLGRFLRLPVLDPTGLEPAPEVEGLVSREVARQHLILPVAIRDGRVVVAMADPMDVFAADQVHFTSGHPVSIAVASEVALREAIDRHFGARVESGMADLVVRQAVVHDEPPPPPDRVHVSLTAPAVLAPGSAAVLLVWAHLEAQRLEVIQRARASGAAGDVRIHSKGPVTLARGTRLAVRLELPDLLVDDPEDVLYWDGEIASATFPVRVPPDARPGAHPGRVVVHAAGLQVLKLHFALEVGPAAAAPTRIVDARTEHHRTAFASYASADRDEVLARVQGMLKVAPDLDVFLDVASLRSGQHWARRILEEVPSRDVFFLFWSEAAHRSEWVEREWRCALERRGIEYIDPVPLVSPEQVPPPPELAEHLHFNDWMLAFARGRTAR
jgi:hypothetical protein